MVTFRSSYLLLGCPLIVVIWYWGLDAGLGNLLKSSPDTIKDTDTITTTPAPILNAETWLQEEFPECVMSESLPIRMNQAGRYIVDYEAVPAYDHETCFVMKARYNCARQHADSRRRLEASNDSSAESASQLSLEARHVKLVYESGGGSNNATRMCDFSKVARAMGGPLGLTSFLGKATSGRNKKKDDNHLHRTYNVVRTYGKCGSLWCALFGPILLRFKSNLMDRTLA
jgi:hypothetical protein